MLGRGARTDPGRQVGRLARRLGQPPGVGRVMTSPTWINDGLTICGFSLRIVASGTPKNLATR
jgi:hypothetical protein